MSVLTDVLNEVKRGVPADHVGQSLGIDQGLAEAAVDHWVRLGIVTPAGDLNLGCTACSVFDDAASDDAARGGSAPSIVAGQHLTPAVTSAPASCAGCPFTPLLRVQRTSSRPGPSRP
ncbi:MAG: hypothetical protein LBH13_02815 [Cellulomonadaceae bacterium]|jgi:hypothetical protein|nr:hypothetical protein [Cellulomonadaceae bacterium]